jgi:hypothetical protein
MYYWVLDLDEAGKPLMFGAYSSYDRAEAYKDKNCSRLSWVAGPTKSRVRSKAKEEDNMRDDMMELQEMRKSILRKWGLGGR